MTLTVTLPAPVPVLGGPVLAAPAAPAPVPAPVRVLRRTGFSVAADGSYAACLAQAAPRDDETGRAEGAEGADGVKGAEGAEVLDGERWFPERWTLAGPEPYTVSLPGAQPEEAGTQVLPLPDGRVLLLRRVADRHDVVLLYPTGPGTGEVPVCSPAGPDVRLLPPSPAPGRAFALVAHPDATEIWQVYGAGGPARVMAVDGRCTGGVWLDRTGRLLALDRARDGRTKAVAADLHTGETRPLLQLTDDSDDRLLLAEPDSGLLLLRSDAPGAARLGWGVLGSRRPVRFPDALHLDDALLTPVAAQPGQILTPETCVVAFRAEFPGGAGCLALWRPGERRLHWRAAPPGWLAPCALWLPGGPLGLPFATPESPCGLAPCDIGNLPPAQVLPAPALPAQAAARPSVPRRPAVLPLQQALRPAAT